MCESVSMDMYLKIFSCQMCKSVKITLLNFYTFDIKHFGYMSKMDNFATYDEADRQNRNVFQH